MGWMWRLRAGVRRSPALPGVSGKIRRTLRPARRKAVRQSERKTGPKYEPEAEIATKAWAQFASTAGPHDRHFRVGCAHATLRFSQSYPGNGITVSNPGRSCAQCSLKCKSPPHLSSRRTPGPRLGTGVIAEILGSGVRRNDEPERNLPHIPLTISSVIFLASPNSIMVLSRQNSGLSTPA